MPSCADVPAVPDPLAARGSYLDPTAEPHHVYWYRVRPSTGSATRATARTSPTSRPAARSPTPATYRSPRRCPPATPAAAGCGLEVSWTPASTRDAAGLRRIPRYRRRPVPPGVGHRPRQRLHRRLGAARRRLPLLRPVDRPHRPALPTLTAGAAPVLTRRQTPWASSTSSTPARRLVVRQLGRDQRLQLGPVPAHLPRHQPDQRPGRGPARRRVLPDLQELRERRQLRRHVDARARPVQVRRLHGVLLAARLLPPANATHKQPAGPTCTRRSTSCRPASSARRHPQLPRRREGRAAQRRRRRLEPDPSGLGSGDYCMLSLSNGLFGDAAHTVIPYRAEMSGGPVLHVWNPNRPYLVPATTTATTTRSSSPGRRRGPTTRPGGLRRPVYDGSNNGWFFAIPTSLRSTRAISR